MRFRQGASGYSNYKGIVSPACTVLRPKKDVKINSRFYYYMFRTGFYKNYVERFAYGIADGQIPLRYIDFKRMYSIFPPLEVQNSIVEYLDKKNIEIDRFIENKKKLIVLLEEEQKNLIFTLITKGIIKNCEIINVRDSWLGKMPSHWKIFKGRQLFRIYGGLAPTEVKVVADEDKLLSTIDYYKVDDLNNTNGFFLKESSWKVEARKICSYQSNMVLLPKRGAAIMTNKVTITSSDAVFDSNVMGLRINEKLVSVKFICYWLKSRNLIELSDITTIPQLNNKHIYPLLIPLPSIEEQVKIIARIEYGVDKISAAISKAQKEIAAIKEYREALITDLVTGKRSIHQT